MTWYSIVHNRYPPIVDNTTLPHLEPDSPDFLPAKRRFENEPVPVHAHNVEVSAVHLETLVERNVRQTLFRIHVITGVIVTIFGAALFAAGFAAYRHITRVDPVKPDYTALDKESDTYWTERILIDIKTAKNSPGTEQQRAQRLRSFTQETVAEAMTIESPYGRAQAVTEIAQFLAAHDINISFDAQLSRLNDTPLIVAMRARALVSQALMYLRTNNYAAAHVAVQQYNQLLSVTDLKLNSPINEESFFGIVTVLWLLGDKEGLLALFELQKASTMILGIDQQMRAYRLIAGEQVRVGMTEDAQNTAKMITQPLELSRAWALILQYSARQPRIQPREPVMFDLLEEPQSEPPTLLLFAEQAMREFFQYLAESKDVNTQTNLLRRIAGSRLMCDVELYKLFRTALLDSEVFDDRIKRSILNLLDDPESPTIRTALNLPPRADPMPVQQDSAHDDWSTPGENIYVEALDIDPTPLKTRADQQWVEALLAIAQGYQSIRRFQDADRILKQAFVAAQKFTDQNVRNLLLLRIGERQVAVGSIAEAQKTFAVVAPELQQEQKGDLARLQILGCLFDDAFATISNIELPANREYACSFLLQELIRTNRLKDAEKILVLLPPGSETAMRQSRLNIARGGTSRDDFLALGLTVPDGNNQNWEPFCVGLIQQGFLHLADQYTDRVTDEQKRNDLRKRICREYLSLYQAFDDANDPSRTIRQELQQTIISAANRTGLPLTELSILTEFLIYHAGQLRTEADRTEGKRLWTQAIETCRKLGKADAEKKTELFAQLIVVKNLLENPNLARKTMPLFTGETNAAAFSETSNLINECLALVNELDDLYRWQACAHLARALVQVGRTRAAQMLLNDHILPIAEKSSDHETVLAALLSTIPVWKAMNSSDAVSMVYRVVINEVAREYAGRIAKGDVFEWRMRDSDIEQIVRSQLENGFVNDAVESADRLNEPLLRDRLLRIAAYIYLDQGNTERAEYEVRRLKVKEIQSNAVKNVQIIKRRAKE